MNEHVAATTDCRLVGDYVDEAERAPDLAVGNAEVVRPRLIGSFLDLWGDDKATREFTVLLRDGRVVAVRGNTLRYVPHPVAGQDVYSVVVHAEGEELLVALFKSADVVGVFHGELRVDRQSA
jgi:hypothetical protein